MQGESGHSNRTLRFNVNLLFTACQFQRFDVAVCKVLRDFVSLTLGEIEIGEVLSLPSSGTDVTHAIVYRSAVLDPVNLDRRMPFLTVIGNLSFGCSFMMFLLVSIPINVMQASCKGYC